MRGWPGVLGAVALVAGIGVAIAQTPPPLLGNIQTPYARVQSPVKVAGVTWDVGRTAYGPVGTPLVLSGSSLGGGGTVQFTPYASTCVGQVKANSEQCASGTVQATVTLWTQSMLVLTVPSGAYSGLVTVTVEGQTSNGLPFLVTPGTFGSCGGSSNGPSPLQIVTASLNNGAVNRPYNAQLGATGGTGNYSWSLASGNLPSGLALSSSGVLSGTPTATTGANPAPFTIKVTDSGSPCQTDEALMSLTIEAQAMVNGAVYGYTLGYDAAGNVNQMQDGTYSSSSVAGSLPAGPGVMGAWTYTYDPLNRLTAASCR